MPSPARAAPAARGHTDSSGAGSSRRWVPTHPNRLDGVPDRQREGVVTCRTRLSLSTMRSGHSPTPRSPSRLAVVDTRAQRRHNLDDMLIDTTPGGKDIWSILEYKIREIVLRPRRRRQPGDCRALPSRGTPNAQKT